MGAGLQDPGKSLPAFLWIHVQIGLGDNCIHHPTARISSEHEKQTFDASDLDLILFAFKLLFKGGSVGGELKRKKESLISLMFVKAGDWWHLQEPGREPEGYCIRQICQGSSALLAGDAKFCLFTNPGHPLRCCCQWVQSGGTELYDLNKCPPGTRAGPPASWSFLKSAGRWFLCWKVKGLTPSTLTAAFMTALALRKVAGFCFCLFFFNEKGGEMCEKKKKISIVLFE